MSTVSFKELQERAKSRGINIFHKTGAELEKLLAETTVGALSEKQVEAKEARTGRRKRRGGALLGKGEAKLNRPEYLRKGFKRHWFKDEPGRLDAAVANDWDYVLANGQKKTLRNGTNRDGGLRTMYLMEKHEDWYKEDQLKKREQDRKNEALLRSGKAPEGGRGISDAQTQWSEAAAKAEAEAGTPVVSLGGMPTFGDGAAVNTIIKQ